MRTIVLGGGIIGVTTAYFLVKTGDEVTVIERQPDVALETSFANAGLISPGHSYAWASPQAPQMLIKSLFSEGQALRMKLVPDWRMYAWCWQFLKNCTAERSHYFSSRKVRLSRYSQLQLQQVSEEEQLDYEQTAKGLLYLHRDQKSLDLAVANLTVLTDSGLELQTLSKAEVLRREPTLAATGDQLVGAIYCPSDETGDARLFTKALYEKCVALGVKFKFGTRIDRIAGDRHSITGVETSLGHFTADRYVIAMGCYSPQAVRRLGYNLPVYPVKGYSVTFPIGPGNEAPSIGGVDEHSLIAWAPFGNRLRFTSTAEFAGFDLTHKPRDFTHTIRAARSLFPNGADFAQPSYWACLRPMTPGGTPIIGKSNHGNLFFNTGHGHLGWTWSCGTAKLLVDIMQGREPDIDMTSFTLAA